MFECVELELALKLASGEDEPFDSDFSCPIKLHRGRAFTKLIFYPIRFIPRLSQICSLSFICSMVPAFKNLTGFFWPFSYYMTLYVQGRLKKFPKF